MSVVMEQPKAPSEKAIEKLQEAALEESDKLVAELQAKYPMMVE